MYNFNATLARFKLAHRFRPAVITILHFNATLARFKPARVYHPPKKKRYFNATLARFKHLHYLRHQMMNNFNATLARFKQYRH